MDETMFDNAPFITGELVGWLQSGPHGEMLLEELGEDEYLALMTALYCD